MIFDAASDLDAVDASNRDALPHSGGSHGPALTGADYRNAIAALVASTARLRAQMAGAAPVATCAHGISTAAGCGQCMADDEQMGAHYAARFEQGE